MNADISRAFLIGVETTLELECISIAELARRIGKPYAYTYNVVNQKRIYLDNAFMIAKALNKNIEELIERGQVVQNAIKNQ